MPEDAVLKQLADAAIVPVIVLDRIDDALPLAHALAAGGLHTIELTLRTSVALDAIGVLTNEPSLSSLVVGAGTVRTPQQARDVIRAGAQFVVSPGFDVDIVAACQAANVATLPGIATGTEILQAQRAGLGTVKFFPAEASGGLPVLSALAGPFFDIAFMPTGGITATNAAAYLDHKQVAAVGGSWMVPADAIAAHDWAAVTAAAVQCAVTVTRSRKTSTPT